jgi:hypothetical protein
MRYLAWLLLMVAACCSVAASQNGITFNADPKDLSRPVSTLLNQLRKRERIPVTYEDPRYATRDDMGGKNINFTYSPDEILTLEGPEIVLSRMLREYGASGGLTFALVQDGPRFHVIPNEVLDKAEARVRQDSILDTVINVPAARRSGGELLQAICDEIKKQTGYEIGVGPSAPGNYLARYATTEGIINRSANAALQDLLDSATPRATFVWDLYYDPADRGYGLNFAYVGSTAMPAQKH